MKPAEVRAHFDRAVDRGMLNLTPAALSRVEIGSLIRAARVNLTEVAPHNRPFPWVAYNALYDACRQATDALLGAYGHKALGIGAHEQALRGGEALLHALGDTESEGLVSHVRTVLRQRRHEIHYEGATDIESDELDFARHVAERIVPVLIEQTAAALGLDPEQLGAT